MNGIEKENENQMKKVFGIGSVCILTYFMSYFMRNLLTYFNNDMKTAGYETTALQLLASTYAIAYAAGQLVNGSLGDYLKSKYMVLTGYALGGTAMMLFPRVPKGLPQGICFAVLGFGFSMLRGPLVKTISENMLPKHARISCTFFSVSCHAGPMVAALIAMVFRWQTAYTVAGAIAWLTALLSFLCLTLLEKKGYIAYRAKEKAQGEKKGKLSGLFSVFRLEKFWIYLLIGMVVEISATSITFYVPMYVKEYILAVPPEAIGSAGANATANLVSVIIQVLKAVCPFLGLLGFRLLHENDAKLMRVMFAFSVLMFAGMYFTPASLPVLNIAFFLLAVMSIGIASAAMWSIYVPSLAKSGKVSGANGVLDCSGYVGASLAGMGFALVQENLGWRALILVWGCVAAAGFVITLFASGKKKETV